jgi:hypothetical protein
MVALRAVDHRFYKDLRKRFGLVQSGHNHHVIYCNLFST